MKKIISIILILLLVFSLSSCGNSSQDQIPSETQLPEPSVSADEDTTQKEDASSKTEVIHIASLKGPTPWVWLICIIKQIKTLCRMN